MLERSNIFQASDTVPGRRRLAVTTVDGATLTFLITALALCILLPGMITGWRFTGGSGGAASLPLQWVLVVYSGMRLATISATGVPRPMTLLFWFYVYVWHGLSPMPQILAQPTTGQPGPVQFDLPGRTLVDAQLVVLVGLLALELGILVGRTVLARRRASKPCASGPERLTAGIDGIRIRRLVLVVIVFSPVLFVIDGGVALFHSREALGMALYNNGTGNTASGIYSGESSGVLKQDVVTVISFTALYGALVARRFRLYSPSKLTWFLLSVVTLVLNFPISQPRFWVTTMLVALVFFLPQGFRRPVWVRAVVVGGVVIGILLFTYANYFRYSSHTTTSGGIKATLTTSYDYAQQEMIAVVINDVHNNGFRLGHQLLGDLFFFVPRSLWHGKPTDTGSLVAIDAGHDFTNLSAPLWAEMYIDFGFAGVVVCFFLYGLLVRRLDDAFVSGESPFVQLVVPLVAGYSGIVLRGSLLQAMGRLAVILLVAAFLRARRSSPSAKDERDVSTEIRKPR